MAYIDVEKIENIRFMCHKILPLVYDESLSYYETLCKISNKLNETIDATNQLEDNVSYLNGRVTDLNNRVTAVEGEIDTFEANIRVAFEALKTQINNDVDAKLAEVDAKLNEVDVEMLRLKMYIDNTLDGLEDKLMDYINDALSVMNERIDLFYYNAQNYVDRMVQELLDEIPDLTTVNVTNPVTGKLSSIQTALDDMFMNTRYNALTCDEFNHLGWSIDKCQTLMSHSLPKGWSVIEWLTNAKDWINKDPKHLMHDCKDGSVQYYKKEIEQNTDMFRVIGCLSMSEIGDLDYTYQDFVDKGLTCYQLAWLSNRLLTV